MTQGEHEKQSIGIVIQARMGSSRLPGKVMKELCGRPLLGVLLKRLQKLDIDDIELIVATTDKEEDKEIADYCEKLSVNCIVGNELNVFERFRQVAMETQLSHLVRLTADNPLINEQILKGAIRKHLQILPDLSTTRKIEGEKVTERYAPKGHSVDIINCNSLMNIDPSILSPFEQEHVIPFFYNGSFNINYIKPDIGGLIEMTVDTQEEFDKVSKFISQNKVGQ